MMQILKMGGIDNMGGSRLLFRASDFDYSANKFHKMCNGIKNTITIIQSD